MKKIVIVLLSVAMLLAFASCAQPQTEDPQLAYETAAQKTSALKDSDIVMTMDVTGTADGQEIQAKVDATAKCANQGENPEFAVNMKYQMQGITMEIPMYYKDGYVYTEMFGQKIKGKADADTLQMDGSMQTFSKEFFKEIKEGEATQDGVKYSFVGDPEKVGDLADNLLGAMNKSMSGTSMEAKITKIDGSFTVNKEGYLSSQELNMEMASEKDGKTANYTAKAVYTVNNPGEPVTIEFPDFSEYQETNLQGSSINGQGIAQ